MVYTTSAKQPLASVPRMVTTDVPTVVGVPDRRPEDVNVRPAGSVPFVTAKVYGSVPPLPVIVWLYATATVPLGSVAGDSVIAGQTPGTVVHVAFTLLSPSVTAPLRASARPMTLAPEMNVMLASAMIFPANAVALPNVAELPTRQNTLQGAPPLIITT